MNDEYRFRQLGDADQAVSELSMVCLDDEAALLLGERLAQGGAVEVWMGDRLVGRVASAAPAPAAVDPAAPVDQVQPPRRFKPFWAGGWRRGAERS